MTLFTADLQSVGDFGHTDRATFSRTLDPGDYMIEAGVRNIGEDPGPADATYASRLLIDNVHVQAAAAPEPTTWALMLTGFLGAGR